ncbi:hypothetical protein AKJ16_DCAP14042, partial [Drosera capensis]
MAWSSLGISTFQKRVSAPQVIVCRKKEKRERDEHPYKVIEITPPPRNLGICCFPSNLQRGESVEIEGQAYTVSSVTHRYQLRKGKYESSEKRLDVLSTGRYILNFSSKDEMEPERSDLNQSRAVPRTVVGKALKIITSSASFMEVQKTNISSCQLRVGSSLPHHPDDKLFDLLFYAPGLHQE